LSKFPLRIKQLREEKDLTQKDLAQLLKSSPSKISMWERGERDPVSEDLAQIAKYFNVTTDYLLGISDIRDPYEIKTIAAHHEGEEWTEEELAAIEAFKAMVRSQKRKVK
jgi:transcriptional regulator with XRE-family HTH domain